MTKRTRHITLSAMFMALAVLFPMLLHGVGAGSILLPMFWPVLAAAFFVSLPYAMAIGLLSPMVSSLLTGMPPISPPILHILIVELIVLAAATQVIYRETSWGIFWPSLIGLLLSRIVLFFMVTLVAPLLGLPAQLFSMAMVLKGLPGVVAMLIVVPLIVSRVKHEPIISLRNIYVKSTQDLF